MSVGVPVTQVIHPVDRILPLRYVCVSVEFKGWKSVSDWMDTDLNVEVLALLEVRDCHCCDLQG